MVEEEQRAAGVSEEDMVHFILTRVPFFLEPDYIQKPESFWESHDTRMIRKFGSKEAFDRVKAAHGLVPRAQEVGIDASIGFDQRSLDRRKQSSTLRSHRLVQFVAQKHNFETSEQLYDILNRKHFIEGGVLNDMALLLEACDEAGVDKDECRDFLLTDKGSAHIMNAVDIVHSLGIHSIPTLIVDGQHVVNGAARAGEVAQTLRRVVAEPHKRTGKRLFGDILNME